MPITSARIPAAAIDPIDAAWMAGVEGARDPAAGGVRRSLLDIVIVVAWTGIVNAPAPNMTARSTTGPGTTEEADANPSPSKAAHKEPRDADAPAEACDETAGH